MKQSKKKPVTIKDLAKSLDIPLSTVGNILSNDSRYSESLRKKVMESAAKMGYRRNILASGLRGRKTNTIGILWSLGAGQASAEVVRDLASRCFFRGYTTLIADSMSDPRLIDEVLANFIARGVDGVVCLWGNPAEMPAEMVERLKSFENVVLVRPRATPVVPFKCVIVPVEPGIHEMVDHWVASGRKKPAVFISADSTRHKIDAFFNRYAELGCPVDEQVVLDIGEKQFATGAPYSGMSCKPYYDYLKTYFSDGRFPYDALFCGVDEAALAAITWFREHSISVPETVAVAGFNDSEFAAFSYPPIASISRSSTQLTQAIVDLLFADAGENDSTSRVVNVPYHFTARESAGMVGKKKNI
jgi:LacI family transcriptional regulator